MGASCIFVCSPRLGGDLQHVGGVVLGDRGMYRAISGLTIERNLSYI